VFRAPGRAEKDFASVERGWIYQEVYLSHRLLSSTKHEISWMCYETFGCECNFHVFGQPVPKQLGKQGHTGFTYPAYKSMKWSEIVEAYSRRKFTFEGDRLPALAGIVRYFQETSQDILPEQYLCGLWNTPEPQGWVGGLIALAHELYETPRSEDADFGTVVVMGICL
jgi:hypothetical protein